MLDQARSPDHEHRPADAAFPLSCPEAEHSLCLSANLWGAREWIRALELVMIHASAVSMHARVEKKYIYMYIRFWAKAAHCTLCIERTGGTPTSAPLRVVLRIPNAANCRRFFLLHRPCSKGNSSVWVFPLSAAVRILPVLKLDYSRNVDNRRE